MDKVKASFGAETSSPYPCTLPPDTSRPKTAVVFMFPGQGAQYTGMGKELYETSQAASHVFDMAEKMRPGTKELCFSGSQEELAKTKNTQPCLYCVELAAAAALKEAGIEANILAGFSLGELTALAFSGAVSYEDGFRLVCKRAEYMQKAAESMNSVMVAVLKLPDETVIELCAGFENVYPVNFNCPGQIVAACGVDEHEHFKAAVKEAGGKVMQLKTGGGFHSPFMAGAASDFAEELTKYEIGLPAIPIYSNYSAKPYEGNIRELLTKQICNPVLWEATVRRMISVGAETFIEVGPGKTLCGLLSRISGEVRLLNVEDSGSLGKTLTELGALECGVWSVESGVEGVRWN